MCGRRPRAAVVRHPPRTRRRGFAPKSALPWSVARRVDLAQRDLTDLFGGVAGHLRACDAGFQLVRIEERRLEEVQLFAEGVEGDDVGLTSELVQLV